MAAETPESIMSTAHTDRRPAIWPWLVMPLIALTAFYYLNRLSREANEQADLARPPSVAAEAAAQGNP